MVGANVSITLLKGGSAVSTLSASTPNSGTFTWSVPSGQTIGTDYRIRVASVASPGVVDTSDADFSIVAPTTITVTSPNGGEQWDQGTSHSITWNSVGAVGTSVTITLLKGGVTVSTLAASASNTGSFAWNIPSNQLPGGDYAVHVSSVSGSECFRYQRCRFLGHCSVDSRHATYRRKFVGEGKSAFYRMGNARRYRRQCIHHTPQE